MGRENPIVDDALRRGMLIPRAQQQGRDIMLPQVERMMRAYHLQDLTTPNPADDRAFSRLRQVLYAGWERYVAVSETNERSVKLAAMLYLDKFEPNMPEWKKQELVHEAGGSPDFLQKTRINPWLDTFVALFYNARKEAGLRTIKAIQERPGEMAMKSARYVVGPAVLMWLLASGKALELLAKMGASDGDDEEGLGGGLARVRDMYAAIPEYYKTQYRCMPIRWIGDPKDGKVLFLTLPMEDYEQLIHQGVWAALEETAGNQGWSRVLDYAGGQLPAASPIADMIMDTLNYYVRGINPRDHRGSEILDQDVARARDWRAARALGKNVFNQTVGSMAGRLDTVDIDRADPEGIEKWLKAPGMQNLVGRWIRISNKGVVEPMRAAANEVEQRRARTRLDVEEDVAARMKTGEWPARSRERVLTDGYYRDYLAGSRGKDGRLERAVDRRTATPAAREIMRASSKEARKAMENALGR
jgi:hypothetical protein